MKTNELLTADESVVTYQLKGMKISELERHVKKILLMLGDVGYDEFMSSIIKLVPTLGSSADKFTAVQAHIRALRDEGSQWQNNTVERLTAVVMLLIAKRFNKILKEKQ